MSLLNVQTYPKEYSQHALLIMWAFERGYRFDFDTQQMITPRNKRITPKLYGRQRYPIMTINDGTGTRKNASFAIHKFVGYTIFGEIALRKGVNVRHKDDNPMNLSRENIDIGSSQDNNLDKHPELRKKMASKARSAQGIRPGSVKVTDAQAEAILRQYLHLKGRNKRAPMGTINTLQLTYPFTRQCIQAICTGKSFPDIYQHVIKEQYE